MLLIVRDVSDLKLLTRTTKGRWCFLFPFFILILCTTIFSTRNKLEEVARIVAAENRHTWTTALEIEQWISINRERKQIHSAGMRAFLTTSWLFWRDPSLDQNFFFLFKYHCIVVFDLKEGEKGRRLAPSWANPMSYTQEIAFYFFMFRIEQININVFATVHIFRQYGCTRPLIRRTGIHLYIYMYIHTYTQ